MRIGMLCDVYRPHTSGVINEVVLSKRALEGLGHEVFIFTFGDLAYLDSEPNVFRSAAVRLPKQDYNIGFRYGPQIRSLLRTMDVIHVHQPFISGHLALRYRGASRIPIVFTFHTRYDLYTRYYASFAGQLGAAWVSNYLERFCGRVDLVIAPSLSVWETVARGKASSRVALVPNGIDLADFSHAASHPASRRLLGLGEEDIVLCYLGRLGPEKNLAFLLRAFALAAHSMPRLSLVLVGDGPERRRLHELASEARIADRVHFLGMKKYEQVPSLLSMCDAGVTASLSENHPLSVLEQMAVGLPVIALHSPGTRDTVVHGQTGLVAQADDPLRLASAIETIARDRELRARLGRNASRAVSAYDIRTTSKALEQCYHSMLEHVPSAADEEAPVLSRRRRSRFAVSRSDGSAH